MTAALSRVIAAVVSRIPAANCCPHTDLGDDADTAYLPADTTHPDYRGGAR